MNKFDTIPTDKHVFVCGKTGTGKSFLAEQYVTGYEYVVKLDTKNETAERKRDGVSAWKGLKEGKDFSIVSDFESLEYVETKKIIYVPDYDEQTIDQFNHFFRWIFERENTVLWIDELMSIGTTNSFPREYGRLCQQGRSKNIALWNCTQRPSGIPSIALASSSYFFVFDTNLPQDRKKLYEVTGQEKMLDYPKNHNFWYYKMGDDTAVKAVLV